MNPRLDLYARHGNDRSLSGSEFWLPLTWDGNLMSYADIRLVADDRQNQEGNLGFGLRTLAPACNSIFGVYGFIDRRQSFSGNYFTQGTTGAEILTPDLDLRTNIYVPFSRQKTLSQTTDISLGLTGTALSADKQTASLIEKPLTGADVEAGWRAPFLTQTAFAETRVYAGAFHFAGQGVSAMNGYRFRVRTRPRPWLEFGLERQYDNIRGFSEFAEMRVRLQFEGSASQHPAPEPDMRLTGRMDEQVVRDIDIVTRQDTAVSNTGMQPVLNKDTGDRQRVYTVDNSAAPGGDGSMDRPLDTLAAARTLARNGDIIYVRRGDGTTSGMDHGIALDHRGQALIGSASPLTVNLAKSVLGPEGVAIDGVVTLLPAQDSGPVITNAGGDGVNINANNVSVSGLTVNGATGNGLYALNADRLALYNLAATNNAGDGIRVEANGAQNHALYNSIQSVTTSGNHNGIRFYAADDATLSASLSHAAAISNQQHGVVIYDDSAAGSVNVDMGGGSFASPGYNILAANTLEDVALDIDGGTLHARNNWWGQAGGPLAGQIYKGAPLDDNLANNWQLDESSGTVAADRIGGANGALQNNAAWQPANGQHGGAIALHAADDAYIDTAGTVGNGTDHLSVSYWINPASLQPTATQVAKWGYFNFSSSWGIRSSNADGSELFIFIATDNADSGNNYFTTSDAHLTAGAWSNITLAYDGTGAANADRLKVYKDGVQLNGVFNGVIPAALNASNQPVTIGRELIADPNYAKPFDGQIDDLRIYNQSLTAGQIAELVRMNAASAIDNGNALSVSP